MSTQYPDALRTNAAWRASIMACLINALATPLELWVGRFTQLPKVPIWSSAAFGAAGFAVLLFRRSASITFSSWVFVLQAMAVSTAVWSLSPAWVAAEAPWTPFQANKLGMLTIAALGPELLPGLIGIACFTLAAMVRVPLLESPSAADEPGVMFIFLGISAVLLVFRVRGAASERALTRANVAVASSTELNRRLLAMRDLANTPLQTLEVGVSLLAVHYPQAQDVTGAMGRAVVRMRDLQPLLADVDNPSSRY